MLRVIWAVFLWMVVIWLLFTWPIATLICMVLLLIPVVAFLWWQLDREDAAGIARVQGRRR